MRGRSSFPKTVRAVINNAHRTLLPHILYITLQILLAIHIITDSPIISFSLLLLCMGSRHDRRSRRTTKSSISSTSRPSHYLHMYNFPLLIPHIMSTLMHISSHQLYIRARNQFFQVQTIKLQLLHSTRIVHHSHIMLGANQ